jgi:hypothetical protein
MHWQHMLSTSLVQPKGLRGPLPSRAEQVCAFVIVATHAYSLFFEPWPVVALSHKLSPLHDNRHPHNVRAACGMHSLTHPCPSHTMHPSAHCSRLTEDRVFFVQSINGERSAVMPCVSLRTCPEMMGA